MSILRKTRTVKLKSIKHQLFLLYYHNFLFCFESAFNDSIIFPFIYLFQIAIFGKNFCTSAKNAFSLIIRNVVRVAVVDKVTDLVLFISRLVIMAAVGELYSHTYAYLHTYTQTHTCSDSSCWCVNNDLELNVKKTKEISFDFRAEKSPPDPLIINGEEVEIVDNFKFLGTTISNDLKWETNARLAAKKQIRDYFSYVN